MPSCSALGCPSALSPTGDVRFHCSLSNPSSTCDDANANPRHLLPLVKLMLACWGPLSTGYGHLLTHCSYFCPEHSVYGVLLVSLTVQVHLSLPRRHCIYVSLWQCSTGRSCCFPVAGGLRGQDIQGNGSGWGTQRGLERN